MPTRRPRVIGPDDLLDLRRALHEKPAPLIYFSDREFARLIKGALALPRRPRGPSALVFDPWQSGGMVQGECESPPGQICSAGGRLPGRVGAAACISSASARQPRGGRPGLRASRSSM